MKIRRTLMAAAIVGSAVLAIGGASMTASASEVSGQSSAGERVLTPAGWRKLGTYSEAQCYEHARTWNARPGFYAECRNATGITAELWVYQY
ncbi:hypothetical protein [Plantactinospora sp. WMMB782]|uniref:hypothetical protein n=1 Tax=Plantactinospora sp. WMMB782 TaxID=3404121 RepID=UPI003B948716